MELGDERSEEALADEAMAWVLRLTSGEADADERAAFIAWRDRSPAHAAALAEARDLWTELGPALVADQERRAYKPLTLEGTGRRRRSAGVVRRWSVEAGARPLNAPQRTRRAAIPAWAQVAAVTLLTVCAGLAVIERPFSDLQTRGGRTESAALVDGTKVELAPESAIDVDIGSSGERIVTLVRGEAMFDVAHDTSRPFIVRSGQGQVRVLGTAFSVRRAGGMTRVTVTRGKVEVTSGPTKRTLTPDRTVIYGLTSIGGVQAVDADAATAWTRGRLVFENRSLGDVIAELDRFDQRKIVLLGRGVSEKRVNAVVVLDQTDGWLRTLEQTQGVTVTHLPGAVLIR